MPSTTPLTDAINALTTYSNTVTGASDTTLSDAVATLAAGYGGGGGGSYSFEMLDSDANSEAWNSSPLKNTMANGGYLEAEVLLAAQTNIPNILSVATSKLNLGNWNTPNAIHFMLAADETYIYIRQASTSTIGPVLDITVPHILKVDKDYVYIDGTLIVATHNNIKNATLLEVGAIQGNNRYAGHYNYVRFK